MLVTCKLVVLRELCAELKTAPHLPRQTTNEHPPPEALPALINTTKMSSHCHDEHDHSGHSHSHGDDHAGHDHSDDITPALQYSLYQHINFDDISTLNESVADSGKDIVKKTWAERLDPEPELESDTDEQLIMYIPYV